MPLKTHYRVVGDHPADPLAGLMRTPIRGDRLIHVDVATILSNRERRQHSPVVQLRELSEMSQASTMRGLYWNAPCRFVHHEHMRIEGTNVQNWI